MTRVFDLGDVVVMTSQHQPRNGKPMHGHSGVGRIAFVQQATIQQLAAAA